MKLGAGEVAQWLKETVALPEGPRFYPQPQHVSSQASVTPVPRDPAPFSDLQGFLEHTTHIYVSKMFIDTN